MVLTISNSLSAICGPGTYVLQSSDACEYCDIYHYQDEANQDACKECPTGFTTREPGAKNIFQCQAGLFCMVLCF